MNLTACAAIPTIVESRTWYRAVQLHHISTALATSHSTRFPTRYNSGPSASPPFETLYLAENHQVALFEVQALLGSPLSPGGVVPHPRSSWATLNIDVNLRSIVDLTDVSSQAMLRTTAQELTGDWRYYQYRSHLTSISSPAGLAPTQELGAALFLVPDLEGFITISAKLADQKVLVVFPQKLHLRSSVKFYDSIARRTVSIP